MCNKCEESIEIRPFQPQDQSATKQIILAGLAEHWGKLNPSLNPDLNNIARSYAGQTFLVAVQGETIVGCGALIEEGDGEYGRIVRMSVDLQKRRQGIGRLLLHELETAAKHRSFSKIVLETTQTWQNAITFYQSNGFQIIAHHNGNIHFYRGKILAALRLCVT
jgi:ribosomal protein S18 acetylase RimI-like enzyme